MARTVALVAERLPIPGLAQMVIGYVWNGQDTNRFRAACRGGYYEVCEELMGPANAVYGLGEAGGWGHVDIVRLMITGGANYWSKCIYEAACGGHMDVVLLAIERDRTIASVGLWGACEGGRMDVALLMIQRGAGKLDEGLWRARRGGHTDIVRMIEERMAQ